MWRKHSKVCILTALFVCTALPALAASTLTVGSRGDQVRAVQKGLRSQGYKVNVSGVYTKETAKAVSKYQKDKKIQVSGDVGGWTYYLLTGSRSMLPANPPKNNPPVAKKHKLSRSTTRPYRNINTLAAVMPLAINWSTQRTSTWAFPTYLAETRPMVLTARDLPSMSFPITALNFRVWPTSSTKSVSAFAVRTSCRAI